MNKPYVYKLTHKETGQFYFGYRMRNKVAAHLDLGIKYKTSSAEIKEIGFNNFSYEVVAEFIDSDHKQAGKDAYCFEQITIKHHFDNPLCLNKHFVDIESGKRHFRCTGHTDETRTKISNGHKGKTRSESHKANLSANNVGMTGLSHSEESRLKMSEAQKGRKHSEETKAKMRATRANISDETRQKLREASLGHGASEETREKLRKAATGKSPTPETREKLRLAGLKRYAKKKNPNSEQEPHLSLFELLSEQED